jgi:uncharacterized damage-inducible protein DinB
MPENDTALALVEAIDAEQRRLRELLSGKDPSLLAERPPNGQWSVIETVRHLLFAEQAHFGRFAPGGPQWSPLGLAPTGMQRREPFRTMGNAAVSSVEEVLQDWASVHASAHQLAQADKEEVREAFQRNLRHLRSHIKGIERLLRSHR